MFQKINKHVLLNLLTIVLLLALPYYLFAGKLYVGGDDTRLLYTYPFLFLKNVALYSWYNFSSVGMNVPNQFSIPFLTVWALLGQIIPKAQLDYLSFSLPIILGLIYFQKFVKELFSLSEGHFWEAYIGSLCFILSPIIIINQLFIFLTTVWLLGVVPIIGYYFIKYLRDGDFSNIYKSMWISILLASAFLSIPWILGFILPLFFGSLFLIAMAKKNLIISGFKRGAVFVSVIVAANAFWILGFLTTYIELDKSSGAVKLTSKDFLSTFALTVNGTAVGNIFYPILNLFHRAIAVGFGWKLSSDFFNFYDKIFFLSLLLVGIIVIGAIYYKVLDKDRRKIYVFLLISLVFSLYFFTVNIGPLKDLFLEFGKLPGFIMFRNFYDKFAPGFVFIYSLLLTMGLVIMRKKYPKRFILISCSVLLVIIINFIPVKSTVTSPLWTTKDTGKSITFPKEYLSFMSEIEQNISPSNNILSVPFGTASYTVVKDESSNSVYAGISPVRIFSGVNDISGDLSLSLTGSGEDVNKLIIDRKYSDLSKILKKHNVNYLLLSRNIPREVLQSYIFNYDSVKKQDKTFIKSIAPTKILESSDKNYALYSMKNRGTAIDSINTRFEKVNQVKYLIHIRNLKKDQSIKLNDTYSGGWKFFPETYRGFDCQKLVRSNSITECKNTNKSFSPVELAYLWQKSLFQNTHRTFDEFGNEWTVNYNEIKNLDHKYYKQNPDGSLEINLILYFRPQLYFYYGSLVTLLVILGATIYYVKKRRENE